MSKDDKSVIIAFEMAIESISFALYLSSALLNNRIIPSQLNDSFKGLPNFIPEIDWDKNSNFNEQAEMLPLGIVAFWMTACVEGYFDLTKGNGAPFDENEDLYSAQMILKIIRNSMGHPFISGDQVKILWNVKYKKYRQKYVVKELGIILDARNLDKKEFKIADFGDWPACLKKSTRDYVDYAALEKKKRRDEARLQQMIDFLQDRKPVRTRVLEYFGETV